MKEYDHKKIEQKWQKEWVRKKIYKTSDTSKKNKFYILDMFPYVSGEGIHVGHPKGYIATDVVSRMKRMQGYNVLHPMGFDAFGLPAENYAIKTKTNPAVSVAKNIARFKKQLEIIGFDYDWSREVNTSDPKFYKWTQWIFLKLLEKGLAYESNEPVNWCPKDKTILANEDVEGGKCERCGTVVEKKPIRQWVLKITNYADRLLADLDKLDWPESIKESQRNWIGKSEGAEVEFKITSKISASSARTPLAELAEGIKVFTTRPDTIFGATYLVLAPEHDLVQELKSEISNWDEVEKYIQKVKNKTDIERTAEDKDLPAGEAGKTGIELKGIKAINPANTQALPVYIADYVLASYGTGAIMAVPAHDQRDFEFARKYNLPIKEVIEALFIQNKGEDAVRKNLPMVKREAVVCVVKHWKEEKYLCLRWRKVPWSGFVIGGIDGGNPVEAGKREIFEETGYKNSKFVRELGKKINVQFYHVLKKENRWAHFHGLYFELENGEQEEISEEEKNIHDIYWLKREQVEQFLSVPDMKTIWHRVHKKEEPYIGNGIVVGSGKFDGMKSEQAKKEITKFVGGKMVTKYKLRDWVFSRQRYWGEPIPVLRDGNKIIPVKEKDLPVVLPKVKSYEPTGMAESPLAGLPKWINVKVGKKVLRRESNTMPQWAGSSWYYLRYMDPKNNKALVDKKKEKYWNVVDLYVGGAEHATRHLIYARFWHKFLYDIGAVVDKEPFKRLQHVGLIIASDGRKMSKRFGNIINPEDIISTYGADTLRLYEMFMGPFDQAVAWSEEAIIGPRRFLERVWKVSKTVLHMSSKVSKTVFDTNAKFERLLHKTIKKVTEDIESMHFNTAISTIMILLNEMEKSKVSMGDYKKFLQILAPFAPHLAEELWQSLGNKNSIHLSAWPTYDPGRIKDEEIKIAVQINGKVRAEIMIDVDEEEENVKKKTLKDNLVLKYTAGRDIKKIIYVKNRLINIVL